MCCTLLNDLSKSKLYVLTQCEAIQDFIKQVGFMFYQNMVELVIPDVLRPIPTGGSASNTTVLRTNEDPPTASKKGSRSTRIKQGEDKEQSLATPEPSYYGGVGKNRPHCLRRPLQFRP